MKENDRPITIRGIIPAAGLSRRMGRAKQTLPFDASTVVGTVVRTMLRAGVDCAVVVTRPDLANGLDLPDDGRLVVIFNDDPSSEMIDSIRLALKHMDHHWQGSAPVRSDDGIMVVPGDMPTVPLIAYEQSILVYKRDPSKIVIASHRGKRGHPMIFPVALATALIEIKGGLNELPRRFPELVRMVDVSDQQAGDASSGVVRDIDCPADYGMLKNRNKEGSNSSRD